ncbi:MAG TPA: caspase family protein [Leptolyngbyaceae cyanobacterium M33_DOE_097]|uniref:DUF4384 domain-containing protein n=1 Tax=Oscillatoriales cyanobacterium SpSt-418 TaxID=2282169 RepID=A0A7C3KHJ7_9CYAN|nr:caspase family protein [Leptolyngbyaceae cyanobacterium M33_DOE_097]
MHRRYFLHAAGATLATLGLNQWEVMQKGDRYAQALAQSTPRKLALLVGINEYPESSNLSALQGCVTDVELQRQLLIHRFGFNSKDILTLTNGQATRKGILTAFETHLIQQAKPGDVVVFHYSGHGSQVVDPDKDTPDGLNSTFVPVDSVLPLEFPAKGGTVKDIMGHTLFLLMAALQTENVTAVLDSCHSGGGTRGVMRVRSRDGGSSISADPEEFDYQKQWLAKLNLSPAAYKAQRRKGVAKGTVIASARRDQLAADAPFSEFYAGAFTYLMTQYLWQQTGRATVINTVPSVARNTTKVSSSNQEPQFEVKPGSNNEQKPIFFVEKTTVPAEAVITKVSGNTAEVWLGGLAPESLVAFDKNAMLAAVDASGKSLGQIVLRSRDGLVGRGQLIQGDVKPGGLLQEQMRGVPTNFSLIVGLDPSLGNELEQAQAILSRTPRVQTKSLKAGEVHYILARVTPEYAGQLRSQKLPEVPPVGSLGLFTPGLEPIPGSFGATKEAIAQGLTRLQPKFKALLAARLVKLTLNSNASRLNVAVSMQPVGKQQLLASQFTVRGTQKPPAPPVANLNPQLPLKTAIQFQIQNNEAQDLYLSVLGINSDGEMAVLFPNRWTESDEAMRILAKGSLQLPNPTKDGFSLVTQEPKGATEVLILASTAPFGKAMKALQSIASRGGQTRGPVSLAEPVDVVNDLLADLSPTRSATATTPVTAETHLVDTTQTAALSITFEII